MKKQTLTAYMFAVMVNEEAIALYEKAMKANLIPVICGESLYEARTKLQEMEEYEREHRSLAMAYIVEWDGLDIYELLVEFYDPEQLVLEGLLDQKQLKAAKTFKRQMLRISSKVKRFDAAL